MKIRYTTQYIANKIFGFMWVGSFIDKISIDKKIAYAQSLFCIFEYIIGTTNVYFFISQKIQINIHSIFMS